MTTLLAKVRFWGNFWDFIPKAVSVLNYHKNHLVYVEMEGNMHPNLILHNLASPGKGNINNIWVKLRVSSSNFIFQRFL